MIPRLLLAAPSAILLAVGGCKAEAPIESSICLGIPQTALAGHVTDVANILNDREEAQLSERLARYEARTKHQMVVATVPALNGAQPIEYATCLGRRWQIGRKDENDGILILVAPNERQMSIATGHGIEKILTDEKAKAVIVDQATPHFRSGDYFTGLSKGIESIAVQTGDNL
ncbi:MAG: TPM domain-containing protein [Sphingopyxis sp.]|uniref:TPM domain-containing protein n=1 Tax=Sphingopyxis sp. TaxID=1908224 RepID=UPI002AB8BBC4|nr:TPM domain-containing protein [Sphingopyxis sp.]MDZ3831725.1 TPM domain-containing protein [Sphingopyxis sp.]